MNTTVAEVPENKPMEVLRVTLNKMENEFTSALPSEIPAEQFVRIIMTAVQMDPKLLGADRRSLVASCMKSAQDGLLPDGREAALVIFKTKESDAGGKDAWIQKVQYMPMVYGLIKKMRGKAGVTAVSARVVYEKDRFSYTLGDEEKIEHSPCLTGDRGPVIGVYAIARLSNGEVEREYMPAAEIDEVRSVSKAGDGGPWGKWYGEMAKKTVIKRLAKRLPAIDGFDRLIEHDDYDTAMASSRAKDITPERPTLQDFSDDKPAPDSMFLIVEETGEVVAEHASAAEYADELTKSLQADGIDFHAIWENNQKSIDRLDKEHHEGCYIPLFQAYDVLCKAEDEANGKANGKVNGKAKTEDEPTESKEADPVTTTDEKLDWSLRADDLIQEAGQTKDPDGFLNENGDEINSIRAFGMTLKANKIEATIKARRKFLAPA